MAKSGTLKKFYGTKPAIADGVLGSAVSTEAAADIIFSIDWSVKSQSVVNNTSVISWVAKVYLKNLDEHGSEYTGIVVGNSGPGSTWTDFVLKADGKQVYKADNLYIEVKEGQTKTIASGEFTVTHNNNGTKSVELSGAFSVDQDPMPYATKYTGSGENIVDRGNFSNLTFAIDTISRHAILTGANDFTDEDTVAISYAVPSGITGYIYLSLDGNANTETTALKAVTGAGTYNYSFSANDQQKLWTIQDQGLVRKRVRFFIKSTSDVDGLTYREPSPYVNLSIINYMPTLDPEVWDSNEDCVTRLTGNQYILVKGVSNASFTTGGQAHKGATIDAQTTFNAGISKTGPSGVYEKVSSNVFDFSIVDNYGRTTPATMEFDRAAGRFVDYVKLTCNVEVTEMTADGDIQATITGKCFNGNFGAKTNRLRVFYDLTKNNEDEFEHVDLGYADLASNYGNSFYVSGNDYTYTLNISGLEYLSVYDLRVWVADEVATAGVSAEAILASTPIFDWGRQDFNFNVPVTIQGGMVPTIVEQGTHWSGWNYRKWSDGLAECWMTLEVTTAVNTSTNASWYSSGELSETNLSFPFEFIARPSVTVQTMPTGSSWCIVFPSNTTGSTTKTGSYQLNSMSSTASRKHLLAYDVKGYWY